MSKKTVVDAVYELRGSLKNCKQHGTPFPNIAFIDGEYWISTIYKTCSDAQFVCTRDAFLQCVAEMSEGLFVPDCRPKQPEIQYDKDGNGWEVGAVYEFSTDGSKWFLDKFVGVKNCSNYESHSSYWEFIRECQSPMGKVHIKPVELVDGAAYQFEVDGNISVGLYEKECNSLQNNSSAYYISECTNIIRLVTEVK